MSATLLRTEVANYLILAERLKEQYAGLDDETLKDTLEGISELPEIVGAIIRSSLDDEAMVLGIKSRLEDLQARLGRVRDRYEKKRALARWAMAEANLPKVIAHDFSVSLRACAGKLEVIDETQVPPEYFVPQPPRLDRRSLTDALKRGTMVNGALLVLGGPAIAVRVR